MYMKRLLAMLLCVAMLSTLLVGGVSAANEDVYIEDSTIVIEDGKVVSGDTSLIDSGVIVIGDDSAIQNSDAYVFAVESDEDDFWVDSTEEEPSLIDNIGVQKPNVSTSAISNDSLPKITTSAFSDFTYVEPTTDYDSYNEVNWSTAPSFNANPWGANSYYLMLMHVPIKVTMSDFVVNAAVLCRGQIVNTTYQIDPYEQIVEDGAATEYAGNIIQVNSGASLTLQNNSNTYNGGRVKLEGLRLQWKRYSETEMGYTNNHERRSLRMCAATKGSYSSGALWNPSNSYYPTYFAPLVLVNGAATIKETDCVNNSTTENGSAIQVASGTLNFQEGSTVKSCKTTASGGAIYYGANTNGTINSATLQNCSANGSGGAVYLADGSEVAFTSATIKNTKSTYGGGIFVGKGAVCTLTNTTIENCAASYGGAVEVKANATFKMTGGSIKGCSATEIGGALYIEGGTTVELNGVTIEDCSAKTGGAIYVTSSATIKITDTTISQNKAIVKDGSGGAMYINGGNVTVSGNSNINNNVAYNNGAAIRVASSGNLTIEGSTTISNNSFNQTIIPDPVNYAHKDKGGQFRGIGQPINKVESLAWIVAYGDTKFDTLHAGKINDGDTALSSSSTITFRYSGTSSGKAYFIFTLTDEIVIKDVNVYMSMTSSFSDTFPNSVNAYVSNTAITGTPTSTNLSNKLTAANNPTGSGDGVERIYKFNGENKEGQYVIVEIVVPQGGAWLNCNEVVINGYVPVEPAATNTYGGGIYNEGETTISGGTISSNTATNGGGVYVKNGTVTISGGTISANTATNGGGIYSTGALTTTGGTISNHTSITNGAGVYIGGGSASFGATTINNNQANFGGGLYVNTTSTITFDGTTFRLNKADNGSGDGNGGAMWIGSGADVTVKGNTLMEQNVARNNGGAMAIARGCTVDMEKGTLRGNIADKGGAVSCYSADNGGNPVFNLKGGTISGNYATTYGGGVCIRNGNGHEFSGGTISGNYAQRGAGVYVGTNAKTSVNNGGLKLSGNVSIQSNGSESDKNSGTVLGSSYIAKATVEGGGIYIGSDQPLNMNGGTVDNNVSITNGGGIYAKSSTVSISGGTISNNKAYCASDGGGGGIYATQSTLTIGASGAAGPSMTGNGGNRGSLGTAAFDGGAIYCINTPLTIHSCTISQNRSCHAAVYLVDTSPCTMNGGKISENSDGGVFLNGTDSDFTMNGGEISGNILGGTGESHGQQNYGGAGICSYNGADVTITGGKISDNHNNKDGATTTEEYDTKSCGGGIAMIRKTTSNTVGPLTITGGEISGNTANIGYGGGIYIEEGGTLNINAAANNTVTISKNEAKSGGGIYINREDLSAANNDADVRLYINGANISENTASGGSGGGILMSYCKGISATAVTITNSAIDGNVVDAAGADGGGIYCTYTDLNLTNSVISDNKAIAGAGSNGGGVYFDRKYTLTVDGCQFIGNKAYGWGGGLYLCNNATGIVNYCSFNGNIAGSNGGGLAVYNTVNISVDESYFGNNQAYIEGVTTENNGSGGAIAILGEDDSKRSTLTLSNSGLGVLLGDVISPNYAYTNGGGLLVDNDCTATISGKTSSCNNTAGKRGGGMYFDPASTVTFTNTEEDIYTVSDNKSDGEGAGIYTAVDLTVSRLIMTNNKSKASGGAMYINNANVSIDNKSQYLISYNTAEGGNGGGICVVGDNGELTLTDAILNDNTASGQYSGTTAYQVEEDAIVGAGGGVAVFDGGSFTFDITNNSGAIYGNNASTAGDDVFANGLGTSLELPAAAAMDTAGSGIENGIWCEDYMDGDRQYAQGLNGGNGYNYGRYDSAAAAIRAYASPAEGAATNYINDGDRFVAITFDIPKYSVGSIKITAPDVSDTNQMFAFVINGTTIKGEQVTVNVSVKAGQTVEVSQLFAGNYTVIMDADWSWRYTVNGITVDGEDNVLGEVSIGIVGRTVDEVHTVVYTAEANESKWLTHNSNNVTNTASVPAQVVHHFDMAAYDKRQLV